MASAVGIFPAYSAFESQLKTLCLREFPCGAGSWRDSQGKIKKQTRSKDPIENQFSVTIKDFGAQHEKTETLDEYVASKFSPWCLDYSWSNEARQLREISVKSPWLIDDTFVLNYFKTLRIVDKHVTEVDSELLKFGKLEELTLSANYIHTVNSRNLPRSLQVLELCANQISDLSALCVQPPPLIHLGLGFNKISFIGDYITEDYWPNLLSLDLSNNNLSDLLDVVRKLGTLPKLRNLILNGNPLALIAGYRGYTIDSLKKLSVLDDIMISADERHHFKGLARRREFIIDEAKVTLEVTFIKGLPVPEEMKNPDEQPEFPIVERKYFVQFMFLEDIAAKAEVFQITHDDLVAMSQMSGSVAQSAESPTPHPEPLEQEPTMETIKNVDFKEEPEFVAAEEPKEQAETAVASEAATPQPETPEKPEEADDKPILQLAPVQTEKVEWAEEVELNWTQTVVRDELLDLRDFLTQGMEFSVVEEVVLAYPAESPTDVADSPSGTKKGKDDKGGKGDKKGGKEEKAKGKDAKDDKKKKKKGEPEQELRREPPTYTTLATWHIPLEDFLDGDYEFMSIFSHGGVEVASTVKSVEVEHKKDGKKEKDGKDKKKPDSSKAKDAKAKETKGSAKKGKDDDKKGKGKGDKGAPPTAADADEAPSPPPALEVQVGVKLHHWETAMDSIREEQEKNKALEEAQAQA